jgi:hypothetical protein
MQSMSTGIAPQLLAESGHEVREFDQADMRTAPEMIVDLGDGGHPQARVLQRMLDILGLGGARLHTKQADHGDEAVLDAVAHLSRQQRLVPERLLQPGVGLLTFDRNTEQAGKAGKKIGVILIELAGIGAVDFQHAEGLTLSALFDQDVDGARDAVIRQQLRCAEAGIRPQVV